MAFTVLVMRLFEFLLLEISVSFPCHCKKVVIIFVSDASLKLTSLIHLSGDCPVLLCAVPTPPRFVGATKAGRTLSILRNRVVLCEVFIR